jgi:NADH:ubiquinone oxidoreductase subunit F (NADH-binding)
VFEDGVGGAPTLLHNVETLAHLALIARYGPEWYRSGTATKLFTVRRADEPPTVVEATPDTSLEGLAGPEVVQAQAVLIGGYHGTWMPVAASTGRLQGGICTDTALTAQNSGAPLGAGLVAVLPQDRCGIVETSAILRYLALESAGQCGPCLNGLPRIAAAFAELARPSPQVYARRILDDLSRWAGLVAGRGACRHPDGSARLALSALDVFTAEAYAHTRGQCRAPGRPPMLPTRPLQQGA